MIAITNSHVTINVKDLDRSVSFYESIGFKLENRWGDHYAQLSAPGITIGLHPSSNLPGNSGGISIGFTSDKLADVKSSLENLAISVKERNEEGGEFLMFNDPDGTALYFIKPKW